MNVRLKRARILEAKLVRDIGDLEVLTLFVVPVVYTYLVKHAHLARMQPLPDTPAALPAAAPGG